MNVTLQKLDEKYNGTIISGKLDDERDFSISLNISYSFTPSKRELSRLPKGERAVDYFIDHYEDEKIYNLAIELLNFLNKQ